MFLQRHAKRNDMNRFAQQAADSLFRSLDRLHYGQLQLVTPDGQTRHFSGKHGGITTSLVLKDWRVLTNLLVHGDVGFGEDYGHGRWETDNLPNLLELALQNQHAMTAMLYGRGFSQWLKRLGYGWRRNSQAGSRKNIRAHYDLGNDFYQLWLDDGMTYSAALFHNETDTLAAAQNNKYDRLLGSLGRNSGSMLEIGCGWGGLAERALHQGDYTFKGITLSTQQQEWARQRLGNRATIALEDYRKQTGTYDHIVSIEMFEAVGEQYWPTYFNSIKSLLNNNGKAVVQTITIAEDLFEDYRTSTDFIRSHIFPGGMLPSQQRFAVAAQKAGLQSSAAFTFGLDYARTLEHWLQRFDN
jgi:cyclopropane-fatty-acyl-phospholipid synthase